VADASCTYCGANAVLTPSEEVYGRSYGCEVWYCKPCGAWVGAHPDGKPKGTLANAELRRLRTEFHHRFDRLWKAEIKFIEQTCGPISGQAQRKARGRWYKRLGEAVGLPLAEVHGGQLTSETAPIVLAALEQLADSWFGRLCP
jgi:hypothetical protein